MNLYSPYSQGIYPKHSSTVASGASLYENSEGPQNSAIQYQPAHPSRANYGPVSSPRELRFSLSPSHQGLPGAQHSTLESNLNVSPYHLGTHELYDVASWVEAGPDSLFTPTDL